MQTLNISIYLSLAMCLLPFLGGAEQNMQVPLTVTVKPVAVQNGQPGIQFKVEILNKTDKPLEITTGSKVPPFTTRIVDEQGFNLNKNETKEVSKNRTNKGTTLLFGPYETKTYDVIFSNYIDDDGKKKSFQPGTYLVSVALPIVSYDGGSYNVDLVHSNRLKVIVK